MTTNSSSPNDPPRFSYIQKFFWILAGAEIHILKNCPGDYNRQATIGFTILVTCIIAMVSGGVAGYIASGENLNAAIVFGLIWSILVYAIDRQMVLSIKKQKGTPLSKILAQVVPRFIFASLVAFLISIPLELVIFEEIVELQMQEDNITNVKRRGNSEKNRLVMPAQKKVDSLDKIIGAIEEKMNLPVPLREYQELEDEIKKQQAQLKSLESDLDKNNKSRSSYWQKYDQSLELDADAKKIPNPTNPNFKKWKSLNERKKSLKSKIGIIKKNLSEMELSQKEIVEIYNQDLKEEKDLNDSLLILARKNLTLAETKAETSINTLDTTLKGSKGLVRQYEALENAASQDETLKFFLWLIRIVFFMIEIIPVLSKISTPIGDYDEAVRIHESGFAAAYQSIEDTKLEIQKRKLEAELEYLTETAEKVMEAQLKKNEVIIDELTRTQIKIAEDIMKKWTIDES